MARLEQVDRWMVRLAEGDRSAFDPLYEAVWPAVHAVCLRRLGDPALAEDAAQQAMIAVFRKQAWWDPARPALPWILGFAVREASHVARRQRLRAMPEPECGPGMDPEDAVVRADLLAALQAAMLELSPADSLTLQQYLNEAPREASPTLRKRLERARMRLLRLWRTRHGPA